MAESKSLITNQHRLNNARQFMESITEPSSNVYYLFTSKHVNSGNGVIVQPTDNQKSIHYDIYKEMIFGKMIGVNDFRGVVRNIPYVANTAYSFYDHEDTLLISKDYYVVVNASSYYHVFKCLWNNMGQPSIIQPDFGAISANDTSYMTSDNYIWKYMGSTTSTDVLQFGTVDYFPIVSNTSVVSNATDGSIDVVAIDDIGQGYSNYISGTFSISDIALNGNNLVYALTGGGVSTTNSYYAGCYLYITSGTGIGQFAEINNFFCNTTSKFLILTTPFLTQPQNGSTFEIYPKVNIIGDDTQSVNAAAMAIIDSSTNSVSSIEILQPGLGYRYAVANVYAHPVVNVQREASVRPILPPRGGHGYDIASELGSNTVSISVKFGTSDANTLLTTNDYSEIGLIVNPLFANVQLDFDTSNGTFVAGETVYTVNPVKMFGTASIATGSNVVTFTDIDTIVFNRDDTVMFASGETFQYSTISAVTNSTSIVLTTNSIFTNTASQVFIPNEHASGDIATVSVGTIFCDNVFRDFNSNNKIIGEVSGTYANVTVVKRNDIQKNFRTFINLWKYNIDSNAAFQDDEIVIQTDSHIANAIVHSVVTSGANTYLYTSNQNGTFSVSNTIIGSNSGATANVTNKYSPELMFGSGEVLYVENFDPIVRQPTQTESFKLIISF